MDQTYSSLITRPLKNFIPKSFYSPPKILERLECLPRPGRREMRNWGLQSYLSFNDSEKLAIGLHFIKQTKGLDQFESVNSQGLKGLSLGLSGISLFLIALKEENSRSQKLIKLSRSRLHEALEQELTEKEREVFQIYCALVEIAMGDLRSSIKYFIKSAKASPNPNELYLIIEKVYEHLGERRYAKFYQQKQTSVALKSTA